MRWFFLLLLLLNMALYAWHGRVGAQREVELPLTAPSVAAPAAVQGVRLLSEAQAPSAAAAVVDERADTRCLVLGGFDGETRARQLEQRLLSLDISVRVVSTEASVGSDHWVYIPPLASRQASQRQLRELQARGIDSYLITEGELASGILLGVFPRLEAAAGVADRLRGVGYAPQVRELPRIHQDYWVQVAEKGQRLLDGALLQRLRADFPDLKHQLISCSGVAQR